MNTARDVMFNGDARLFINQSCTIVKQTKSGLIQVSLNSNPKKMISIPAYNITFE